MSKKVHLLIQARMGSSRLPGKVLKKITGVPMLLLLVHRVQQCKNIDNIIICTSTEKKDDKIYKLCIENKINVYRGSENDVLDRYYKAAIKFGSDIIIRGTGDCPMYDVDLIDGFIKSFLTKYKHRKIFRMKYVNNKISCGSCGFPDGSNPEIFTFDVLKEAWTHAKTSYQREHVSPYIFEKYGSLIETYDTGVNVDNYKNLNLKTLHLSVDTLEDFNKISGIFEHFSNYFSIFDVLDYLNTCVK